MSHTNCVICRTKQSYKVFVMIPHLDWAILTSSCHPAAIITVGTGSGDEFPPLLRFRLDAVFVLFPLGVDVPQSHCATMIIKIYALNVSYFEMFWNSYNCNQSKWPLRKKVIPVCLKFMRKLLRFIQAYYLAHLYSVQSNNFSASC